MSDNKIRTLNKKELRDKLHVSDNRALKRIVERAGIIWQKGHQIFTPVELEKILTHFDY